MTKQRFSAVLRKFTRYGEFLRWLAADGLWPHRRLVAGIIGSEFVALTLQVNAIGLVMIYVRRFERGGPAHVLGWTVDVRQSLGLLVAFGLAVAALFMASALLRFASRTWSLRLRRVYSEVCTYRILSILERAPLAASLRLRPFSENLGMLLAKTDAITCGRILFILVRTVAPLITLVVALAALSYVNPLLVVALLLLSPLAAFFLFRVNVKAAEVSHLTETRSSPSGAEIRRAVSRFAWSPETHASEPARRTDWEAALPKTRRYMDVYIGRLHSVNESELVSNLYFAAVLSVVLLGLGVQAIVWEQGWERMAWCVVAIRYILVAVRELARTFTSVNRFYPQARRYLDFVRASAARESPEAEPEPPPYRIGVEHPSLAGSADEWQPQAGQRLAVVASFPLNRYTLSYLMASLVGDDDGTLARAVASSRYVTSRYLLATGRPERDLHLDGAGWQELRAWAEKARLVKQFERQLPGSVSARISDDQWLRTNPGLKFLAGLVSAMRTQSQWILVEESALRELREDARSGVLEALRDRIVVIVYGRDLDAIGTYGEQVVIVLDEEHMLGLGPVSWALGHRARIEAMLAESASAGAAAAVDEEDFEDAG